MIRRRKRKSRGIYTERQARKRMYLIREVLILGVYTVVSVALAAAAVIAFGLRIRVSGDSMAPQLSDGEYALVNRVAYRIGDIDRYDVVAFYPGGNKNASPYIRRVVGLPGDVVKIEKGVLLINGVPDPGYEKYGTINNPGLAAKEVVLGKKEYFVLSDRREEMDDSRSAAIGSIGSGTVIGKVWMSTGMDKIRLERIR